MKKLAYNFRGLALFFSSTLLALSVFAQNTEGPIHKDWKPSSAPDGTVEVVIGLPKGADGSPPDPEACKVVATDCLKILCKAEAAIYENSPQGRSAASNRARIWAKSHYLQFMRDGGKIKEATEQIADEARREGKNIVSYADPLKKAAEFASSGNVSGFVIVEDGTSDGSRYAVGGTSCLTQQAAAQAQSANKALGNDSQGRVTPPTVSNGGAASGELAAPVKRMSTGNF